MAKNQYTIESEMALQSFMIRKDRGIVSVLGKDGVCKYKLLANRHHAKTPINREVAEAYIKKYDAKLKRVGFGMNTDIYIFVEFTR
jgi:predicted acetyltransferase